MNLKHLPTILFLNIPVTLVITFNLAFYYKHVTYMVPYISDSGALPPESCIFGQSLNILAFLTAFAMYIRYRYVKEMCEGHCIYLKNRRMNLASLYTGLGAAIGVSVVANFQEAFVLFVHVIGAYAAFGLGSVYQCLQTILYYRMSRVVENKYSNIVRIFLSVVSVISFSICAVFATIAFGMYDGNTVQNWKEEDNGYNFHIISTIAEWICAGCTIFFLFLFKSEFENIDVMEPEIFIRDAFVITINNEESASRVIAGPDTDNGKY
ncbi:DNA damage-regulated autophagy modulator protein 1-like [Anoplophora glabripennis]|uniref:DNA damage-regulated autophagy modulator protein 1-like n=1 Tax=Anoplophora glabripennis TaxID=217634 RepID=UPI0008756F05|nr:DNA damage-regulated autophagy modulator protein 1-like [Anoplophora glabripennis]